MKGELNLPSPNQHKSVIKMQVLSSQKSLSFAQSSQSIVKWSRYKRIKVLNKFEEITLLQASKLQKQKEQSSLSATSGGARKVGRCARRLTKAM